MYLGSVQSEQHRNQLLNSAEKFQITQVPDFSLLPKLAKRLVIQQCDKFEHPCQQDARFVLSVKTLFSFTSIILLT